MLVYQCPIGKAVIGTGILLVAKQGLDLASDLQEVQNVVDVTFGDGAKQIDAGLRAHSKVTGLANSQQSSTQVHSEH